MCTSRAAIQLARSVISSAQAYPPPQNPWSLPAHKKTRSAAFGRALTSGLPATQFPATAPALPSIRDPLGPAWRRNSAVVGWREGLRSRATCAHEHHRGIRCLPSALLVGRTHHLIQHGKQEDVPCPCAFVIRVQTRRGNGNSCL